MRPFDDNKERNIYLASVTPSVHSLLTLSIQNNYILSIGLKDGSVR